MVNCEAVEILSYFSDLARSAELRLPDLGLEAADRVRDDIRDTIRELVPFAHQGHRRADLTSRPVRFQTVRKYLIAYAPEEKPLLVLGILHGRRSPRVMAAILRRQGRLKPQPAKTWCEP